MCESEIHQAESALQVLARKLLSILIRQGESAADLRLSNGLVLLADALAVETAFFVAEVGDEGDTRGEKEEAGFPGEGLDLS